MCEPWTLYSRPLGFREVGKVTTCLFCFSHLSSEDREVFNINERIQFAKCPQIIKMSSMCQKIFIQSNLTRALSIA